MFTFSSKSSFAHSFSRFFTSYDSTGGRDRSYVYLFSGPVPQSLEEIPWDIQNVYDTDRNSIAQVMISGKVRELPNADTHESFHNLNVVPVKSSHWDLRRKCWRLYAKTQGRYELHTDYLEANPDRADESDRYSLKPGSENELSLNDVQHHRWITYFGSYSYYNERYIGTPGIQGDTWANYGLNFGGRYSLSDDTGLYMDLGKDVTVDKLEVYSHGSTPYTSGVVVVEVWDETNSVWVEHWRNDESVVSFNVESDIIVDIPQVTARKFKVSGVNTGRYSWHIKHISLLSSVEPDDAQDTHDITWALVYPHAYENRTDDFPRVYTSSETQVGRLPILMCSVGDITDSNHMLILNKARDLDGGSIVRCNSFNIKFSEG